MFTAALVKQKNAPTKWSVNIGGKMKKLTILCLSLTLNGCGAISATSIRCGTDGNSSYLEMTSAPQNVTSNTRAIGEMCAFAYEGEKNET